MFSGQKDIPADMRRVRTELLDDGDALATMYAMLRGPEMTGLDMAFRDLAVARELALRS
ncbi:hypothetical protein ACQ86D_05505 [Streptomyces galilaeus]